MIAIEVSSAAGKAYGGIRTAISKSVSALLAIDRDTEYVLCYRPSRWRRGQLFRPQAPNVRLRILQDPFNGLLLRGARLLHSMGIFVPRTPRVPKLLTIHDLNAVRNTQWVRWSWHQSRTARIRACLDHVDHVITYSAFTAEEVSDEFGVDPSRVHPVLLGVDVDDYASPAPEAIERVRSQHGDYVIGVGLVAPNKNYPRLVEALAQLEDIRLVLVGRRATGEPALHETISQLGMEDRVDRIHAASHDELVALLHGARACAVPSLYEGFGLTPLEAMASGTPVVCSNAASLPEVTGDAALLVDTSDVDAFADGLRRVIEETALADELRRRGSERARKMSWQVTARRLRSVYAQVAAA